MKLSEVDKKILDFLTRHNNHGLVSTYKLAKETGISWATAITHCYKLKSYGYIEGRAEKPKYGDKDTMVWWIPK
jgi:DNA-binding IclR family transcriptional regulator